MNKKKNKLIKNIGLLGGSFDPPHKGHVTISLVAKRKFKLNYIIWAITKKSPFKKRSSFSLNERIKMSKKLQPLKNLLKLNIMKIK